MLNKSKDLYYKENFFIIFLLLIANEYELNEKTCDFVESVLHET